MVAWRYRIAGRAMRLYARAVRPRTFGARAVLVDSAGRIALVKHHYIAGWYLPGGGVDKRESAADAIRRELAEEVAITDTAITGILGVYHNRTEAKDDHVIVFTCKAGNPNDLAPADPREIAEAAWFAPDALPPGTSPATRRRIEEYRTGLQGHGRW
jgi:ADP-ribose pyrophosphatase YjhB (NUDIX family)